MFILKHTQFGISLLFRELIRTQQEVEYGRTVSKYLVLHFPGLALSVAPCSLRSSASNFGPSALRSAPSKTNSWLRLCILTYKTVASGVDVRSSGVLRQSACSTVETALSSWAARIVKLAVFTSEIFATTAPADTDSQHIISYHIVDLKWQDRLKVGTQKPKLKVKKQSVCPQKTS